MSYNDIKNLFNVVLEDPILDYLNIYGVKKGYLSDVMFDNFNRNLQLKFYLETQSIKFKQCFRNLLEKCFPGDFYEGSVNQGLKKQKGVIWNPVCVDNKMRWRTTGDLLIKIGLLRSLLVECPISREDDEKYIIVSIRYSTIHFNQNELVITNQQDVFHRLKTAFEYSVLSSFMNQETLYNKSICIGRKYKTLVKIEEKEQELDVKNAFFKTVFDYPRKYYDDLMVKINEYNKYQELFKNGVVIGENLFPNMKNTHDFPWHHAKKQISKQINEITEILYCTPKNRENALRFGISKTNDPRLTSKILGINNPSKAEQVDFILSVNQGRHFIQYKKENSLLLDSLQTFPIEFYVDFETLNGVNDSFDKFPFYGGDNIIFNIGCYYRINNNSQFKEGFQTFWLDSTKDQETMTNSFVIFMNQICSENGVLLVDCPVFHWTQAEKNFWKNRYPLNWVDLNMYFTKLPIALKGAFNYKLKNIARSLYQNGIIKTQWSHSFADGLGAMTGYIYLSEKNQNYLNASDNDLKNEIIEYNKIDCVVLAEIKDFLKNFAFRLKK